MAKEADIIRSDSREYTIIRLLGKGANTNAYLAEYKQGELTGKCILKEFSPHESSDNERGKANFIASGKMQNKIRQLSALNNQTPPINRIFEANGTVYIDTACFNGNTLDKLDGLDLTQYMSICRSIAKTVGYYHKEGYICLDLKPENIFIMQNAPDDTITQLVEFIDFDSIRSLSNNGNEMFFPYTPAWAAPEQSSPCSVRKISKAADIYAIGEIIFYILFGRHSENTEHRGFSKYSFEECKPEYRKFTARPDIQALFTRLFRNTLRSSAVNRFKDTEEIVKLLDTLIAEIERKDYIIPSIPSASPNFVGRDEELKQITEFLKNDRVLFITGVGGIGKSTLVKNYIKKNKAEYDIIVYLEFDGDIKHTFCDDLQLQISTVRKSGNESLDEYFVRKLTSLKYICGEKQVLFILDNFYGKITKELSRIISCGYDTFIVTRNMPPKNSFAVMEIGSITNKADLFRLISADLERQPTKDERLCFDEIIMLVQGHTLVIELIARQIAAGRIDVHTALGLIREKGFSRFSDERIGSYKDGKEVYDTLSNIISAMFDISDMSDTARHTLKLLALLNERGLEKSLVQSFFPDISSQTLSSLSAEGWLYYDERIRLHSVIAETVRGQQWNADDVTVMEYHKKAIDIYVGMANAYQIKKILHEADLFREQHPRHIITAMYYDMLGCYYDTLADGRYVPYTQEEEDILMNLLDAMDTAIEQMELSTDIRRKKYLNQYYLSMASILIRSVPELFYDAAELLDKVYKNIEKNSDDHCYYCMVSAWYHTLAKPDIKITKSLTEQAEQIAKQVFKTDLEIIDIIHIPTANCFFYHNDLLLAENKIKEAIDLCENHPNILPYIDKKAELFNCLLDIYFEMGDTAECRKVIKEIDIINEKYRDEGIFREVSPEIREQIE